MINGETSSIDALIACATAIVALNAGGCVLDRSVPSLHPSADSGVNTGDAAAPDATVDAASDSLPEASCLTAESCPGTDDECRHRTCTDGTCGVSFAPAGTLVGSGQTAGDCKKVVCDGAGETRVVDDDSDPPPPPQECLSVSCSHGSPSIGNAPKGVKCGPLGSGNICDGKGKCNIPVIVNVKFLQPGVGKLTLVANVDGNSLPKLDVLQGGRYFFDGWVSDGQSYDVQIDPEGDVVWPNDWHQKCRVEEQSAHGTVANGNAPVVQVTCSAAATTVYPDSDTKSEITAKTYERIPKMPALPFVIDQKEAIVMIAVTASRAQTDAAGGQVWLGAQLDGKTVSETVFESQTPNNVSPLSLYSLQRMGQGVHSFTLAAKHAGAGTKVTLPKNSPIFANLLILDSIPGYDGAMSSPVAANQKTSAAPTSLLSEPLQVGASQEHVLLTGANIPHAALDQTGILRLSILDGNSQIVAGSDLVTNSRAVGTTLLGVSKSPVMGQDLRWQTVGEATGQLGPLPGQVSSVLLPGNGVFLAKRTTPYYTPHAYFTPVTYLALPISTADVPKTVLLAAHLDDVTMAAHRLGTTALYWWNPSTGEDLQICESVLGSDESYSTPVTLFAILDVPSTSVRFTLKAKSSYAGASLEVTKRLSELMAVYLN